jgi:predicted TIM-barrel fold metal-dependent hydrolase
MPTAARPCVAQLSDEEQHQVLHRNGRQLYRL